MSTLRDRIAARAAREGALAYSLFVDLALYDPHDGFYATGGAAGRRGDFLTSVEVGPLFGAVLARALDTWWDELGRPDPFRVIECGAGAGTLARTVLAATPRCTGALRYVLVERMAALRAGHPSGEHLESRSSMPTTAAAGVVLANELLDNLAFDLLERRHGAWYEVRVGVDADGRLAEVPATPDPVSVALAPPEAPTGARVPVQRQAQDWLTEALRCTAPGRVVVFDYADTTPSFAVRPWTEWLRTYRGHGRGGPPLEDPGSQDLTCEVAVDQLAAIRPPDRDRTQAQFLRDHGIDELVAEGRRVWHERAHVGDLAALRARSRIREAEALCAPDGLGAFRVLEWVTTPPPD